MYNNYQNRRQDDRKEDKPPYSRVFVVCSKQTTVEDLHKPFEQYGQIQDIYLPKNNQGELKGVAYIKYFKTSSAAAAVQALQSKPIILNSKPIKVMVASSRNESSTNEDRYKRLFIKVDKEADHDDLYEHFSKFGYVESLHLQKDKETMKCKGFAYVNYLTFFDAAKAIEECDRKYKPVFATPKDDLKRVRKSFDNPWAMGDYSFNSSSQKIADFECNTNDSNQQTESYSLLCKVKAQNFNSIIATCTPQVAQIHIEQLFDIVPGMVKCQYSKDSFNGLCKAIITYEQKKSATYALEKINNFEFPSGELVSVKPYEDPINKAANNLTNIVNTFKNSLDAGKPNLLTNTTTLLLADAIAQASSLIKEATSSNPKHHAEPKNSINVSLPPPQPLAPSNSRVAQRCFIVCKPHPPPAAALRDAFCRFGDLIDVCTIPNKTFGFVKYASVSAAQEAMKTLNSAVLCGVQLKVLEADEKPKDVDIRIDLDENSEHENKRIKLHGND